MDSRPLSTSPARAARHALVFLRRDFAAGATVVTGAVVAVAWSALDEHGYAHVIDGTWNSGLLRWAQLNSLHLVAVNGLMTMFFFAVGVELSREIRQGALRNRRHAALPVLAAVAGMAVTAAVVVVMGTALHQPALVRAWGVPMATDIAFTLGALSLAGSRVPGGLRVFLLTLAVADDLLAVVVLGFTSHQHSRPLWLLGALAMVVVATRLPRRRGAELYAVLVVTWIFFIAARVEPALAGVAIGVLVPFGPETIGERVDAQVQPWSNALALPLFALCACGVAWHTLNWSPGVRDTIIVIIAARLVGKTLGITGVVVVGRRLRWELPPGVSAPMVAAASVLCAIGFTVPLLFAGSIYGFTSTPYAAVTLALLVASALATLLGVLAVRLSVRNPEDRVGAS